MHEKLLAIQQEIGAIKKDSKNPFFKSSYFDINSLLAEVKPILNKHGVVLLQGLTTVQGDWVPGQGHKPVEMRVGLCTQLRCISAEGKDDVINFTVPLPNIEDAQKMGGAITYYRRYALQSLLALEAEDDDGETAVGRPTKKAYPQPKDEGINLEDAPF